MTLEGFYNSCRDVDFYAKFIDGCIALTFFASQEDDWEQNKTKKIEKITFDFVSEQLIIKMEEESKK